MFTSDPAIFGLYYTASLQRDSSRMAAHYLNCVAWYLDEFRNTYPLRLAIFRHQIEDGTATFRGNPVMPRMPAWYVIPAPFTFGSAP